jgi:hypothetical protein
MGTFRQAWPCFTSSVKTKMFKSLVDAVVTSARALLEMICDYYHTTLGFKCSAVQGQNLLSCLS